MARAPIGPSNYLNKIEVIIATYLFTIHELLSFVKLANYWITFVRICDMVKNRTLPNLTKLRKQGSWLVCPSLFTPVGPEINHITDIIYLGQIA